MAEFSTEQAARFLEFLRTNIDLDFKDKIGILEYCADEYFVQDENLLFLECKLLLKELHDLQAQSH